MVLWNIWYQLWSEGWYHREGTVTICMHTLVIVKDLFDNIHEAPTIDEHLERVPVRKASGDLFTKPPKSYGDRKLLFIYCDLLFVEGLTKDLRYRKVTVALWISPWCVAHFLNYLDRLSFISHCINNPQNCKNDVAHFDLFIGLLLQSIKKNIIILIICLQCTEASR